MQTDITFGLMIIFQNVVEVKYLQVEELQNEPFSFSLPKKICFGQTTAREEKLTRVDSR
jgi:hypothetical protein